MTNAAITTAAHAAAKYFRICDRHPVKTVLPPCAQDPVENRQPLSVPGRQCRCSGMARRLESKLRKCRWLIWSGKSAGNAISDDHARNRSAVFGRIGPDGRHNDTGAAQFTELITFEICFGDRASQRRRAALAGSPSIVKPQSDGSLHLRQAWPRDRDRSRHAARTSVEARIQLMDAGDCGDRQ